MASTCLPRSSDIGNEMKDWREIDLKNMFGCGREETLKMNAKVRFEEQGFLGFISRGRSWKDGNIGHGEPFGRFRRRIFW